MWVECPTELDTPVLIFGFEVEDIAALSAVMVFSGLFIFEGFIPVFFVTLAFGLGLRRLKKGKAPGVLIHLMHRWDILHIPGVLPVRDVGYSPVTGDFDDE